MVEVAKIKKSVIIKKVKIMSCKIGDVIISLAMIYDYFVKLLRGFVTMN